MKTPDITPAQILALVQQAVMTAAAFGLIALTDAQIVAGFAFIGSLITTASLFLADAHIRNGRSRAFANPEALKELERPAAPVVR